jgi:hypothetical protein
MKKSQITQQTKLLIALKILEYSQARMSPLPPPPHLLQFGTTKRNQENKRTAENQQTQKDKEKKRKTTEKESGSSAEQTKHKHLHTRGV